MSELGDLVKYNLEQMYWDGRGVAKDEAQAIAFFKKACDGNYSSACDKLGKIYHILSDRKIRGLARGQGEDTSQ